MMIVLMTTNMKYVYNDVLPDYFLVEVNECTMKKKSTRTLTWLNCSTFNTWAHMVKRLVEPNNIETLNINILS